MTIFDFSIYEIIFVCAGVFFAGLMDAIAGGGGLISLPAYLISGLPAHIALGTNKLSSCIGTAVSTLRYIKNGFADWGLAVPSIFLGLAGAFCGTKLQLMADEKFLKYFLVCVLPVIAVIILRQKKLPEEKQEMNIWLRRAIVWGCSFFISIYDGFYGPGTGTFLMLSFCNLAKLDVRTASGNVKIVNLSSNTSALFTSLVAGKVCIPLGLVAAVFSVTGHYIGAGLTIKNGSKVVKPAIIIALLLLLIKVITDL